MHQLRERGAGRISSCSEKENISSANFPRWGQALKKEESKIKEERGTSITLPDLCTHFSQDTGTAKKELWSQIYFKFLFSYFIFCFHFCSQEFISLFARTDFFPSLVLCKERAVLAREVLWRNNLWCWINSCWTLSFTVWWRRAMGLGCRMSCVVLARHSPHIGSKTPSFSET